VTFSHVEIRDDRRMYESISPTTYHVFDAIQQRFGSFWTIDEAMEATSDFALERGHLQKLHSDLARRGLIERMRRGVYGWAEQPVDADASGLVLASRFVRGSWLSHVSALVAHGKVAPSELSRAAVTSVAARSVVPRSARRAERLLDAFDGPVAPGDEALGVGRRLGVAARHAIEVGGVRFAYVQVVPSRLVGLTRDLTIDGMPVPAMTAERAMVSCFEHPHVVGGAAGIGRVLREALPGLDMQRLLAMAHSVGGRMLQARVFNALAPAGGDVEELGIVRHVLRIR
jgi:predicted transcriptional regulator of viral defense system